MRAAKKPLWVTIGGATLSADLGGSSKYSSVIFSLKADAGEGFHVNSYWTWVSRP